MRSRVNPKDPTLRKRPLRFDDIEEETRTLLQQAREILHRQHGERLSDNALLRLFARMIVDGAAAPERTKAPYQIAVTICEHCKRGCQDGGGTTVEMSPPALEVALCDAEHIGSIRATLITTPMPVARLVLKGRLSELSRIFRLHYAAK